MIVLAPEVSMLRAQVILQVSSRADVINAVKMLRKTLLHDYFRHNWFSEQVRKTNAILHNHVYVCPQISDIIPLEMRRNVYFLKKQLPSKCQVPDTRTSQEAS